MCLSCGCKKANENHGDDRHITMSDIEAAAKAENSTTGDVVRNIQEGFRQAENAGAAMGGTSS